MQTIKLNAKYFKGEAVVNFARYPNGQLAIVLTSPDGTPLGKATYATDDIQVPEGYVLLKGWSENEDLPRELDLAGVCDTVASDGSSYLAKLYEPYLTMAKEV